MTDISVVIPTFNGSRFIGRALESVREQTLQHWEIIIIDDGSTDDTGKVVAQFLKSISNHSKYHYQANKGIMAARLEGVSRSAGRYIAFLDHDDAWHPEHLEKCYEALEKHPKIDYVFGSIQRILEYNMKVMTFNVFYMDGKPAHFLGLRHHVDGDLRIIDDPSMFKSFVSHRGPGSPQCALIRKSCFAGFPKGKVPNTAEDRVLGVFLLKKKCQFAYYDAIHVYSFIHDSNTSTPTGGNYTFEHVITANMEIADCYKYILAELNLSTSEKRIVKKVLSGFMLDSLAYPLLYHGNKKDAYGTIWECLKYTPFDLRTWKSIIGVILRSFHILPPSRPGSVGGE